MSSKSEKIQVSDFYLKVYLNPTTPTSKGLLIELTNEKGIINIGAGNEEIEDYQKKKDALIKLVTKTHSEKLAEMEKQLNELISKHGKYKGVEKRIYVKLNDKEYNLNFGTKITDKQAKYYVSFINDILKITY